MKAGAYFMELCDAWWMLSPALIGDKQGGGQQTLDHWKGMMTYWEIVIGQSRICGERENKNRKLFNHFM